MELLKFVLDRDYIFRFIIAYFCSRLLYFSVGVVDKYSIC